MTFRCLVAPAGARNATSRRRPSGGQDAFGAWRRPCSQGTGASGEDVECETYANASASTAYSAGRRRYAEWFCSSDRPPTA